jgi:hypothetical protein
MGYGHTHEPQRTTNKEIHPIWRGVGFLLIFLIPALSYGASIVIFKENAVKHWFPIPAEIIAHGHDPLIYAKIILTIVLSLLIYSIFTLITSLVNHMFGASRIGPYDAPPVYRNGPSRRR